MMGPFILLWMSDGLLSFERQGKLRHYYNAVVQCIIPVVRQDSTITAIVQIIRKRIYIPSAFRNIDE